MGDVESLVTMAKQLAKDGNPQAESAVELAKQLQEQWKVLHALTQKRISLAQTYVTFHKRAQEVRLRFRCHNELPANIQLVALFDYPLCSTSTLELRSPKERLTLLCACGV